MKTNLKKLSLLVIVLLSIFNVKANGEDDITIIDLKFPSYLEITAKSGSENTISYVRMYNLSNPSQFNKVLEAESCNEQKNECVYKVPNENLVEGNVYRIEMYHSGSSKVFVIQYIH